MISEEIKSIPYDQKSIRNFGIVMAVALTIAGALLWGFEKEIFIYFFLGAAFFIGSAFLYHTLLMPLYKYWMIFSILLGWMMSRVILSVLFFTIVTPTGLLGRMVKKEFLTLRPDQKADTYWIPRKKTKEERTDYERQF